MLQTSIGRGILVLANRRRIERGREDSSRSSECARRGWSSSSIWGDSGDWVGSLRSIAAGLRANNY